VSLRQRLALTVVLTVAFGLLVYSAALARASGPKHELPPITKEQLSLVEHDVEAAIGLEHRALREMQKGEGQAGEAPLRASQADLHSANDVLETTHGADAVTGAYGYIMNAATYDDRAESDIGLPHLQKLTLEYITKALEQKQLALRELDHVSTQAASLNACDFFAGPTAGDEVKVGEQGEAGATGYVSVSAHGSTQRKAFTLDASSVARVGPFSPPTSGRAAVVIHLTTLGGASQSITLSIAAGGTPASNCILSGSGGATLPTGGSTTSTPTTGGGSSSTSSTSSGSTGVAYEFSFKNLTVSFGRPAGLYGQSTGTTTESFSGTGCGPTPLHAQWSISVTNSLSPEGIVHPTTTVAADFSKTTTFGVDPQSLVTNGTTVLATATTTLSLDEAAPSIHATIKVTGEFKPSADTSNTQPIDTTRLKPGQSCP
jgi:hypothetical protein